MTKTVQINGKEVEIAELSFNDSIAVDHLVPVNAEGVPSQLALSKIYALASVRKVDGELVRPTAGDIQFDKVAQMFTAMDAFALAQAYSEAFPMAAGEQLKNESPAPASARSRK